MPVFLHPTVLRLGKHALIVGVLSAICGFCIAAWPVRLPAQEPHTDLQESPQSAAVRQLLPTGITELVDRIRPAIVTISFQGRSGRDGGVGTGFFVSSDGLIATNLHVIGGEARPISVRTADGQHHEVLSVHASDRDADLAVLRVAGDDFHALELTDSDTLQDGQFVVAVGNPQGLERSVVAGIVSGRRQINGQPFIQLAIPIEPGNSGGPLLDLEGRVHGILNMKSAVTENLGFAVPGNTLRDLIEQPNPVAIEKWLTIGALNPRKWRPLFGADWRQRAGRIEVAAPGTGFGGRSLCLAVRDVPEPPYELAVEVKLTDESGAAGLAFLADGQARHFGFYPSNGRLRLTHFAGPTVYTWNVLREAASAHYRPGEWNHLKVRVEPDRLVCFVNHERIWSEPYRSAPGTQVGLAKFRDTEAEFRGFELAPEIISPDSNTSEVEEQLTAWLAERRGELTNVLATQLAEEFVEEGQVAKVWLRREARRREQEAQRLREVAQALHQQDVCRALRKLFAAKEEADLVTAALLVARLDNEDLDVAGYREEIEGMAAAIVASPEWDAEAGVDGKLRILDRHLFQENGFHGSRNDYYHRANSYLNEVIDDREGLPITLSVLYMALAKELGVPVVGAALPGHFMVQYTNQAGERRFVDVFHRGKVLNEEGLADVLPLERQASLPEEWFTPPTTRAIVVRMLNNLTQTAKSEGDVESVLRYFEAILAVDPQQAGVRGERALLLYRVGRSDEAIAELRTIQQQQPVGIDPSRIQDLLDLFQRPTAR